MPITMNSLIILPTVAIPAPMNNKLQGEVFVTIYHTAGRRERGRDFIYK